jgi:hypothetical protein
MFQVGRYGFDDLLLKTNEFDPFPGSGQIPKPFSLFWWMSTQAIHSQYLIVRALSDKFRIYVVEEMMRKVSMLSWVSTTSLIFRRIMRV